jgi:hypothetical protein
MSKRIFRCLYATKKPLWNQGTPSNNGFMMSFVGMILPNAAK